LAAGYRERTIRNGRELRRTYRRQAFQASERRSLLRSKKLGAKQYAADGQQDRQATSDRGSRYWYRQWIWREPKELKVTGGLPGDVGDKRSGSRSRVDRNTASGDCPALWVTARIEDATFLNQC
jgi:hypothetical protein